MDESTVQPFLHALLEVAFPDLNIYYLPPGDMILEKPCIVYEPTSRKAQFSNSQLYTVVFPFKVTFLSEIPGYKKSSEIMNIPGISSFSETVYRHDDIMHDIYTVSINIIAN